MREASFWTHLAYAACGLLQNAADKSLRRFWIDDFMPESATDTKRGVDVEGTVWIGDGPRAMHSYRFAASIPQRMLHRRQDGFLIEHFDLDSERRTLRIKITPESPVA